jgi:hypothetical protein
MPDPLRPVLTRILVVLMIFTLVMGTSCSPTQALASQPQQQAEEQQPGEAPQAEEAPADIDAGELSVLVEQAEVRVLEEEVESQRYPAQPLGSISFSVDTAASVEREVTAGDDPVEMQVVDGAGLTWMLEIPAGALESTQTLIMAPLSGLDGTSITEPVGEVVSGVRFEPDGMEFLLPVQLSVSGPGMDRPTFILSSSHTGEDVDYTVQDAQAAQPTAHILHFSSYFASQPEDEVLADIQEQAWKEYRALTGEAKKLLKSSMDVPTPPSIPLECTDDETGQKNDEVIQKFVENALNPEDDLIARMLTQRMRIALTGDTGLDNDWSMEQALAGRIVRKAITMMDQFDGQEDKLVAVSDFAITAARKLALLGGDGGEGEQILARLASWNSKLIDKLIKDIKENHNYKRIPVVWKIAYHAELFGAQNNTESFLEKLRSALRFEVQLKFKVNLPDIENITEVNIPVQFDPEAGGLYQCSGSGQGSYLKAEVDDEQITVATAPFPVQVAIKEFDPCNGTVKIGIDRFGSDADTMTFTTEDGSETSPWPISRDTGLSVFSEELDGGMAWFQLQVDNGSANAVDETIQRTKYEVVSGELTIKLIHK